MSKGSFSRRRFRRLLDRYVNFRPAEEESSVHDTPFQKVGTHQYDIVLHPPAFHRPVCYISLSPSGISRTTHDYIIIPSYPPSAQQTAGLGPARSNLFVSWFRSSTIQVQTVR